MNRRKGFKLLAGSAAREIHCGQAVFIVGGTMRVKEKAGIRSICSGFRKGALSANFIIFGVNFISQRRLFAIAAAAAAACWPARALQRSTSEATTLKQQAHSALANGQWDAAIQDYEKAVALDPKEVELRVELGAVLMKAGRLPDSIATFQEALHLAPHNLAAELGLARAYRAVHSYDETKRLLSLAIREHP